jgi:hypothetical protein
MTARKLAPLALALLVLGSIAGGLYLAGGPDPVQQANTSLMQSFNQLGNSDRKLAAANKRLAALHVRLKADRARVARAKARVAAAEARLVYPKPVKQRIVGRCIKSSTPQVCGCTIRWLTTHVAYADFEKWSASGAPIPAWWRPGLIACGLLRS